MKTTIYFIMSTIDGKDYVEDVELDKRMAARICKSRNSGKYGISPGFHWYIVGTVEVPTKRKRRRSAA